MSDTDTQDTVVGAEPQAPPPPATPKVEGPSLASRVSIGDRGIRLANLEELIRFADTVVRGGAAPSWAYGGMREDEKGAFERARGAVAIAIQAGLEHGLGVLGGLQAFMVLDGNLSWKSEYAAGKIRNSSVCKPGSMKFGCVGEGEKRVGWAMAHRVGDPAPERWEFTFDDAKTADLLHKKNWRTYPKRMFQWRAVAMMAKDKFSDVLGGIPLADEVMDYLRMEDEAAPRASRPAIVVPAASTVAALPAASQPDPLFAALKRRSSDPEPEIVLVQATTPAEDAPPFATHAEADKALAEAAGCEHPKCPPERVADCERRRTFLACPDCGVILNDPGDEPAPAASPDPPRPAAPGKPATAKKSRQSRLL